MTVATLDGIVERMRLVPDRHHAFSVSEAAPCTQFRFATEALDEAVAAGLPCASGRVRRFDHNDLVNLARAGHALGLDLRRTVMASRAQRLSRARGDALHDRLHARLSASGPSRWLSLLGVAPRWRLVANRPSGAEPGPRVHGGVHVADTWPELPAPVRQLIDEFGDMHFMRLPPRPRPVEHARRTRRHPQQALRQDQRLCQARQRPRSDHLPTRSVPLRTE